MYFSFRRAHFKEGFTDVFLGSGWLILNWVISSNAAARDKFVPICTGVVGLELLCFSSAPNFVSCGRKSNFVCVS